MEQICKAFKECALVFRRNLRAEYESNSDLKHVIASIIRSYIGYRSAVTASTPFAVVSKAANTSMNILRLSDACIKSIPGVSKLSVFSSEEQNSFQKRLDSIFVIPQYYGGLKDANIQFYKSLYRNRVLNSRSSDSRVPDRYRPSIRNSLLNIILRIRSAFGFGGREHAQAMEIENHLLPTIFKNIASPNDLARHCSEGSIADLEQLVREVRRDGKQEPLRMLDLRRAETSFSPSGDREDCFESHFELEMQTGDGNTHVFLVQGRFSFEDGPGATPMLSGLTWTRIS